MSPLHSLRLAALVVWTLLGSFVPVAASADEQLFANPPMTYFAPIAGPGETIYQFAGVLISYRVGDDYTQAVIHDGSGNEFQFVVGGDFTIEGRRIACMDAPSEVDHPSDVTCPDWPADVRLSETPVIGTYWITRFDDRPMAVLRTLRPYPRSL